jgi:hypothetical protein
VLVNKLGWGILNTLDHDVLPFILSGRKFYPHEQPRSYLPHRLNLAKYKLCADKSHDSLLAYFSAEINEYEKNGFPRPTQVQHPIISSGKNIYEFIYGTIESREEILVVPSFGISNSALFENQLLEIRSQVLAKKWINALGILQSRVPNAALGIKLHPLATGDCLWDQVLLQLKEVFPKLKVYSSTSCVEKLILEASVVVSDISTTFWWGLLVGGKVVISLDIFGYAGGKHVSAYDGIVYVSNLRELETVPLSPFMFQPSVPTVRDYIQGIFEKSSDIS